MISVCMATYNGEKYVRQQVDSILCQLSAEDELIVSDDGSKDDTLAILKSFSDPRVHIFINEGKHGFVGNFSNALSRAKGDYRAMKRMIEEDGLATKCSVASREINKLLTLNKITSKWIELV